MKYSLERHIEAFIWYYGDKKMVCQFMIRNFLVASYTNAMGHVGVDIFKIAFLNYLGLRNDGTNADSDKAYTRCALAGIERGNCKSDDLTRVLGQSAFIDGTPMPWVSDIWAVLGIKLAAYNSNDENIVSQFHRWVNEFLPQRIKDGRLTSEEQSLAEYILNNEVTINSAPCVLLFLHFKEILPINTASFHDIVESFMDEFKDVYKDTNLSPILQALYVFVFDEITCEIAAVPPKKRVDKRHRLIPRDLRRYSRMPKGEEAPRPRLGNPFLKH